MASFNFIVFAIGLLIVTPSPALAYDPSPLQDICVADFSSPVRVNGFACKDPTLAKAEDFWYPGLHLPGTPIPPFGIALKTVNVNQVPGLNTLGLSIARIDYAPGGVVPPHTHPRATEMVVVTEGTLLAGFITGSPEYRHISKVLNKGDVFVFPIGLVHYQANVGRTPASAYAAFNSQNPGLVVAANAVFGSKPPIPDTILAKAFQVDKSVVDIILSKFQ